MAALVSVIIPCWNGQDHVAKAIESALGQTYRPLEVIVIDDGSTDCSIDVLRTFEDRIRWESGPNRGACSARNRGAQIASGEFLQFLDADDVLLPQKIERSIAMSGQDGVVPICGWETIAENGADRRKHLPCSSGADALAYALNNQIQTASPLHQREWFWRVGGFLAGLPCGQERDLHIRLTAEGLQFVSLRELLVRVHRRSGSVSSNPHRVLLEHEGTFLRARDILQARGALTIDHTATIARAFVADARQLVRMGDHKAATRYATRARDIHAKGGLDAFERTPSRRLAQLCGPVAAERIIQYAATLLRGKPAPNTTRARFNEKVE